MNLDRLGRAPYGQAEVDTGGLADREHDVSTFNRRKSLLLNGKLVCADNQIRKDIITAFVRLCKCLDTRIDVYNRDSRVWYNGSGGVGGNSGDLRCRLLGETGADDQDNREKEQPVGVWDVAHEHLGWDYIVSASQPGAGRYGELIREAI